MKVIVIGATGTIGSAVCAALSDKHEIVKVGRSSGDHRADIMSRALIEEVFRQEAPFDAVVSVAGSAAFKPLAELSDEDFEFSLSNKLMGQVNLVRYGIEHISDGGSFTLTSGMLSREPMLGSSAVSLVNAAVEGFGGAAALELPRGVRVNVVSPPWVTETLETLGMPLEGGLPASVVARAYVASVEGDMTGDTLDARHFA